MQPQAQFATTAASMGNTPAAAYAPPAAAPVPNLPQPPFGAPPPGMLPDGSYAFQPAPSPQAAAPAPAAPPAPQAGMQAPAAAASPYGPAPSPAQQPSAPVAGKCDFGHDVPQGTSYCSFGHPITLGDMKFAGGDAFGATAYPADPPMAAPAPLPPTGAMSPFPQQPPAPPAAPEPPYGFNAQPAAQPMPFAAPAPEPAPPAAPAPAQQQGWPTPAQQSPAVYEALAATTPAGAVRRALRGFLYSFHADSNGVFWPLFMGRNILGRAGSGETLEIEIADPTTSSRHATITCDANAVVLEDEGSTNGSFVNDQPVGYKGKIELHDGDRIRFGAYNAAVRLVSR
ncbi:MAG: FHA domain-containing protein [Deltaproteobacteria bacterium]|nr:FHA domain-containing protein [Deltaproteobacteria bacterium]